MGKLAEISLLIRHFNLICLQETWLSHSNKISFKDYNVFRSDRMDFRMGGSMIICKKSLNLRVHKIDSMEFSNCDIALISILDNKLCHERLYFVSSYKPPN